MFVCVCDGGSIAAEYRTLFLIALTRPPPQKKTADYFSSDSDDGDAYSARADRAFALSEPGSSEGGFVIDLDDDDPSLERSIHALLLGSGNVGGLLVIIHVWKHACGCGACVSAVAVPGVGSRQSPCHLVLGAADATSLCLLHPLFSSDPPYCPTSSSKSRSIRADRRRRRRAPLARLRR